MIQAPHRPFIQVAIRPMASTELPELQRALPPEHPEAHVRRLALQRAGRVAYLVAWDGPRPVGHLLLGWRGSTNPELLWLLNPRSRPPYIEALFVHEAYRSAGVGTRLLAEAERLAVERGHRRVGLAVAVENRRAHDLYCRLGYRDADLGQFANAWASIDEHGDEVAQQEWCAYLVKDLVGHALPDATPGGRTLP